MTTIAIIDGEISLDGLQYAGRVREQVRIHESKTMRYDKTHATIIARILETYADVYQLISIRILAPKDTASIADLISALDYCISRPIDMVLLSMGTIIPSDAIQVMPYINRLCTKGVLVIAAQGNNSMLTFPASLPQVISVQRDYHCRLRPGSFTIFEDDIMGVDITVNCKAKLEQLHIPYRNSFAMPYMAAMISTLLNEGNMTKQQILEALKSNSAYQKTELTYNILESNNISKERICRVCVCASDRNKEYINEIMRALNLYCGIHTIGVYNERKIREAGWLQLQRERSIESQLNYLEIHSAAELILIACTKQEVDTVTNVVETDIVLYIEGHHTLKWIVDKKMTTCKDYCSAESIANEIKRVLS